MSDLDPSLAGLHTQDEEKTVPEIRPEPVRQDMSFVVFAGVIVLIVIGLVVGKINSVWKENYPVYMLHYLPDKEVSVKILSDEMKLYVQQNYPMREKRLVVYAPELNSDTCPYRRDFVQALKIEKNNPQWKDFYDFVPQIRQFYASNEKEQELKLKNLRDFMEKVCGYFCIMDTHENWVFEIENGSALPDALRVFKKEN